MTAICKTCGERFEESEGAEGKCYSCQQYENEWALMDYMSTIEEYEEDEE